MITRSTQRSTLRRRAVVPVVTTVAGAVALAGAPTLAGVADAATAQTSAGAHRVLQIDVHVAGARQHRVEQEYFGAHDRYLLISQYGKNGNLDYRLWQKDALGGREHAVKQVAIFPDRKHYAVRTHQITKLPAVSFGVLSTSAQVAQAIRDGAAHEGGLGMVHGRRVRLLTLASSEGVRSALLYVNPVTLAPVASTVAFAAKRGKTTRVVNSYWKDASQTTVTSVMSAPKVPAGYRVTHD